MQNLDIAKFGGTSVANYEAMSNCVKVVTMNPNTKLVVVSACAGVTNLLVELASGACDSKKREEIIAQVFAIHQQIIAQLGNEAQHEAVIREYLSVVRDLAVQATMTRTDMITDRLVSHGELMSSYLITELFKQQGYKAQWFDVRKVMRTDSNFGKATALVEVIAALSKEHLLPLLAGGGAVVLLAAWAVGLWLTRQLVRPITAMAEHLDTIEANVPYEELIPLAHTIQSDRRLRENNEAMRREFTANVSHELKTPLTSISGFAELLETGMAKPADVPVFGQRIHREAGRMIRLVSDILQLSQLDGMQQAQGGALPERTPLDLGVLARDVSATMTMNARKAYVSLLCEDAPAPVLGSRDMLTELITNLCDNAIRYNRPGGHVVLRTGTDRSGASWFEVEDNGIGIPQDAQARVFERFYRVDKSRSKATGGTGLGLAIVKHIAALHGAHIDLRSIVGTGTTIRVTFPAPEKT